MNQSNSGWTIGFYVLVTINAKDRRNEYFLLLNMPIWGMISPAELGTALMYSAIYEKSKTEAQKDNIHNKFIIVGTNFLLSVTTGI